MMNLLGTTMMVVVVVGTTNIHKKANAILRSRTASSVEKAPDESSFLGSKHSNISHTEEEPLNTRTKVIELKTSKCQASSLKIDLWGIKSEKKGDLVAKFHYRSKKIVWEYLDGNVRLKRKIETRWDKVSAVRVTIAEHGDTSLDIQLCEPPAFFNEIDPQPTKHIEWKITTDFTPGLGSTYSRHHLEAPPGYLGEHHESLLSCDVRLLKLSKKPFPSSTYQYFWSNPSGQVVPSDKSSTRNKKWKKKSNSSSPQRAVLSFSPPSESEHRRMDEHSNEYLESVVMPYIGGQEMRRTNALSRDTSVLNPFLLSDETGHHGLGSNKATHQHPPS